MMVYIVVEVTYDYYRFQDNVFASTSFEECVEFCKNHQWKFYDYVEYDVGDNENTTVYGNHHWIQGF